MKGGVWIPAGILARYPLAVVVVSALYEHYMSAHNGRGNKIVVPVAEFLAVVGKTDEPKHRRRLERIMYGLYRIQKVTTNVTPAGVMTVWLTPTIVERMRTYQRNPNAVRGAQMKIHVELDCADRDTAIDALEHVGVLLQEGFLKAEHSDAASSYRLEVLEEAN